MIGQIVHTANIDSIVNYHFKKIEDGVGFSIGEEKMEVFSKRSVKESLKSYACLSKSKQPYTHFSLNFHPDDTLLLTDKVYNDIAKDYLDSMCYGDQPYWIIKHTDQEHPHIHIVTSNIKEDGKKVSNQFEYYRQKNICRKLEKDYGLLEVSNSKSEEIKIQKIVSPSDYKNYLKQSVKEALSYKVKGSHDFYYVLEEKYGIKAYESTSLTGKKGISFALIGEKGKRYINEVGTKAIAGSKLSSGYSYNKLQEVYKKHYQSAPKRYRFLKQLDRELQKELKHFKEISKEDFNLYLKDKGISLENTSKGMVLMDSNGKNLYNKYDLKSFEFLSKLSKTTSIDLNKVQEVVCDEIYESYKKETSYRTKDSYFVDHYFDSVAYSSFRDSSESYVKYEEILDAPSLEKIQKAIDSYKPNREAIVLEEEQLKKGVKEGIATFCKENKLERSRFSFIDERLDKDLIHKMSSNEGSVVYFLRWLEKGGLDDKGNPLFLSGKHFLETLTVFEKEELSDSYQEIYGKAVTESYVKQTVESVKKNHNDTEDFACKLNERGIRLGKEGNHYFAYYQNSEKGKRLYGLSEVEDKILENQVINTHSNEYSFFYSLDREHYGAIYYSDENIKEKYSDILELNEEYQKYVELKEYEGELKQSLFPIKKELELNYQSDFIVWMRSNNKDLVSKIDESLQQNPLFNESFESIYSHQTSKEHYDSTILKEKQAFENRIKLGKSLQSETILGLLGVRSIEDGISDYYGKYTDKTKVSYSKEVERIQEQPYFNFYSSMFYKALNKGEEEILLHPSSVLMIKEFTPFIENKEVIESVTTISEKSYMQYYTSKLEEVPAEEKEAYLNSKGIEVLYNNGGLYTRIKGCDTKLEHNEIGISKKQETINLNHESKQGENELRMRFHLALENEQYSSAVWIENEAKEKSVELNLTSFDKKTHSSSLEKERFVNDLKQSLYPIKKELELNYQSDFILWMCTNKDDLVSKIDESLQQNPLFKENFKELYDFMTSSEHYNEVVEKEKEAFKSRIEIAKEYNSVNILGLLGIRIAENGLSDYGGKYTDFNIKVTYNNDLQKLQQEPYFKYYSEVFYKMNCALDKQNNTSLNNEFLFVFEKFKPFFNSDQKSNFEKIAVKSYIEYYANKASDLKLADRSDYLNSKGIRIMESGDKTELKLLHYSNEYSTTVDLKTIKSSYQMDLLRDYGYLNKESFDLHLSYHNALEKENYQEAVWIEIKNKDFKPFMSDVDFEKHEYKLEEARKEIPSYNHTANDVLNIAEIMTSNDHQKKNNRKYGLKRKKPKKGRKRF